MTTVLMIRSPANSFNCPLREGEIGELSTDLAEQMVAMGLAEIRELPKDLKAIPVEPSIMAEEDEAKPQGRHPKRR